MLLIKIDQNKINNSKTTTSISNEYKTKIIGRAPNDNNTLDTENVVPLNFVSNFLEIPRFTAD